MRTGRRAERPERTRRVHEADAPQGLEGLDVGKLMQKGSLSIHCRGFGSAASELRDRTESVDVLGGDSSLATAMGDHGSDPKF